MKHTDEHIRDIFSQKLGEHESAVPDALWQQVADKLPASTGTAFGVVSGLTKWIAAILVTSAVVVSAYYFNQKESIPESIEAVPPEIPSVGSSFRISEQADKENQSIVAPQSAEMAEPNEKSGSDVTQSTYKPKAIDGENLSYQNNTSDKEESQIQLSSEKNIVHDASKNGGSDADPGAQSTGSKSSFPDEIRAEFTVMAIDKETRQFFFMPAETEAESYAWDFGDGESSDSMSPQHAYKDEGNYQVTLTVTDAYGNGTTAQQNCNAIIPGKIDIPKNVIITPNGDGLNDEFDLSVYSEGIVFQKIQIRNNAGDVVFESNDGQIWQGKDFSGTVCPTGYYQFLVRGLDRNQEIREKRGIVYLQK